MASFPLSCPYCHRATYFDYRDVFAREDYYRCSHCPNEVTLCQVGKELQTISMKVEIKDKFYFIEFWRPSFKCSIHEVTETDDWLSSVLELRYVPKGWLPTNIKAKLHTVLTFL